jgi:hypothetical protein
VQEGATIAYRQDRQRIGLSHCGHACAFDGIDGNIHRIAQPGTDVFADIQHRGFINLTFTDHDPAINIHPVEHNAHGIDGGTVGGVFVAASQPFITRKCGGFGNAGKFDG